MRDDSATLRALKRGSLPKERWRIVLLETIEPLGWILAFGALGNLIRFAWIRSAVQMPSWGGLFLDMVGIAAAGLARGPVVGCGVAISNQIYRMAFGQISNAFVPVEIAGALFWGWMAVRGWVELDWRKPLRLLRTFLLASLGGGICCAIAAWLVNLLLRGQWVFMPAQQRLYEHFDAWTVLKALPMEVAISVWDKSVTVALAMLVLVPAYGLRFRLRRVSPGWIRTLRHYSAALVAAMAVHIVWGLLLVYRFVGDLLTAPVALDYLLLRQTLVVSVAYLAVCTILVVALLRRRRISLNRMTFSLSWITVSLAGLVFFLSGLYMVANTLTSSTYRAAWSLERQVLSALDEKGILLSGEGMTLVELDDQTPEQRATLRFLPAWKAIRQITFGDLKDVADIISPPASSPAHEVEGYLLSKGGLQLALFSKGIPGGRGPVILYQEAPWLFSHGYRSRLVPTLVVMVALSILMLFLMYLLGRQMLTTTSEAVLGRQARALAQRIRSRNRRLEALQVQLETAVAQRESRIRELASLAEVGKAVGVLAHEIRNPIGTIQMAFGNLLEALGTDPTGELQEQVVIIERQIRHMNMLTQSVLAFSRGTADAHQASRCEASEIARNCLALFNPTADHLGVDLIVETPEPDFCIAARENEIIQILQNLLLNAMEAIVTSETPLAERKVVLSARRTGANAFFEVRDTGPGLKMEHREKIFDIFYSHKADGTGLGLFVARELARMLHGDLSVSSLSVNSGEGNGCRFVLRLPAVD